MHFEGSLVVLYFCLFPVERLKEILGLQYGMGGSLLWFWEDRCASKEIWTMLAAGGAVAVEKRGLVAALGKTQKKREYDPTKGYPGEDIVSKSFMIGWVLTTKTLSPDFENRPLHFG